MSPKRIICVNVKFAGKNLPTSKQSIVTCVMSTENRSQFFRYSAALYKHKIEVHDHVPKSKGSKSDLLEKLPSSTNLLHLEVENWLVFQRNTFDHFDEAGDPFVCQIFLIQISTGRYIHRSQGHQVDHGTTLDANILASKLTQVFLGSKACQGFPFQEKLPSSTNLLHLEVENWLVFQRNTFDHFDEAGDPFVCQIFLIQISTGRYIHRSQGHQVDHGTTLDANILASKLTQVFLGSKACQGFPFQGEQRDSSHWAISDYPYRRHISMECQFFLQTQQIKPELGQEKTDSGTRCGPCRKTWYAIESTASILRETNLILSKGGELKSDDETSDDGDMNVDNEGGENDEEDLWSTSDVVADYDPIPRDSPEYSHVTKQVRKPLIKGREYVCICCSIPFPTLYDLARHRIQKRRQDRFQPLIKEIQNVPDVPKGSESTIDEPNPPKTLPKVHKCSCCSLEFASLKALGQHKRKRERDERTRRQVGCSECDAPNIITFKQLIKHVATSHSALLDKYQAYLPKDPNLTTMKEPKICTTCDMVSNGRILHIRHQESYHVLGDYSCSSCQEPCLTFYDLMIHNYQKHGQVTELIPLNYFGLESSVDRTGKIAYKMAVMSCRICLKAYKGKHGNSAHLRRTHSWGRLNCKPCGESCHYAKDISAHMLVFHKDKPEVQCPNCDEKFALKDDPKRFEDHFPKCKTNLKDKGPFQCQYCGKEYAFKLTLNGHIKMHQGIIKFKCQYCEFGTNFKHVLVTHEKMHQRKMGLLTEEPEPDHMRQCKICGKQLSSKKQVFQHVRNVHEGRKRVFQCKRCGEFFKYSMALYKHKIEAHGHVPKPPKY
ncbi:hypothetical protein TCAL_12906, partial [Tigriopus californicus]